MSRTAAPAKGPTPWRAHGAHALAAVAAASLAGAAPAQQSMVGAIQNPPDIDLLDDNHVQADSGYSSFAVPDVSIGGAAGLSHVTSNTPSAGAHGTEASIPDRYRYSGFYPEVPFVSSFVGGIAFPPVSGSQSDTTFSFQGVSERFTGNIVQGQAPGASLSGDGGSLTNNGNGTWTYLDKQGISYLIDTYYQIPNFSTFWPVTLVTYPDGSTLRIHFRRSAGTGGYSRIQGVEKSNGFYLKFFYASNAEPTAATRQAWSQYTRIVAGNRADEYCDVAADICTFSQAWPESQASFSSANTRFSIMDSFGRETRFTLNARFETVAVKPATSDTDTITYEMCARTYPGTCSALNNVGGSIWIVTFPGMIYAATQHGIRTQYHYQPGAGGQVNVLGNTNPYRGNSQVLTHYGYSGQPESGSLRQVDVPGARAYFSGNMLNRLTEYLRTGSTREEYSYDSRRNLTSRRLYPKDGDPAAPQVTTIDYEPACTSILLCNKPRFSLDPKSNRTDYDYYPTHGGIRSVTGPAVEVVTASGPAMVRPQTRYDYVARTTWLKTAGGGYAVGPAVHMPARESFCRTSAATGNPAAPCALAGDQVETVYEYGPDSGPNNLLVRGAAATADGVTIRTCFAYDRFGNKISETTPRGTGASPCP